MTQSTVDEAIIKEHVFKRIRREKNITYEKAGQQAGCSTSYIRDIEKQAEKIVKRVIDQPEPLYFLDKIMSMRPIKAYQKAYNINDRVLIDYTVDALIESNWQVQKDQIKMIDYGIEVLEIEQSTYNPIMYWSNYRSVNDLLNTTIKDIKAIKLITKRKANHLIHQLNAWCKKENINIKQYPIFKTKEDCNPLLGKQYDITSHASVRRLVLTDRVEKILIENNLKTIDDIMKCTYQQLYAVPGLGHHSLQIIIKKIDKHINRILHYDPKDLGNTVQDIPFDTRAVNGLLRNGVTTIDQLLNLHYTKLSNLNGIGKKTKTELIDTLKHWSENNDINIKDSFLMRTMTQLNESNKL